MDNENTPQPETPRQAFVRQMKETRQRRRWTQQQLAERLTRLGIAPMNNVIVAKIERGVRDVTLDEALTICLALGVAPVHMALPREWGTATPPGSSPTDLHGGRSVRIAPEVTVQARSAAEWFRGHQAIVDETADRATRVEDVRTYSFEVSDFELSLYQESSLMHLRNLYTNLATAYLIADGEAALRRVADMRAALDQVESELEAWRRGASQ